MQYTIMVNQSRAIEWGLDLNLSTLFAFLYEVPSWASPITVGGDVWYYIGKSKIVSELPILTSKPDTAYRQMKKLESKGLIRMSSVGPKTVIQITEKGAEWNKFTSENHPTIGRSSGLTSENHPSEPRNSVRPNPGSASDQTSDLRPTNHITNNQVTRSSNQNQTTRVSAEFIQPVFDHWKAKTGHSRARLDEKRKAIIRKALDIGYSVDDLRHAVDGCLLSPFHMGENDSGRRYDGLDLILRDASKIDQFIGFYHDPPKLRGKLSRIEAINDQAVRDFLGGDSPFGDEKTIDGEVVHDD